MAVKYRPGHEKSYGSSHAFVILGVFPITVGHAEI